MTWAARTTVSPEYKRLRPIVWARDKGLCQWPLFNGVCGGAGHQVDHIVPRSRGGRDILANLRVLCKRHHDRKTADEASAGRTAKRKK